MSASGGRPACARPRHDSTHVISALAPTLDTHTHTDTCTQSCGRPGPGACCCCTSRAPLPCIPAAAAGGTARLCPTRSQLLGVCETVKPPATSTAREGRADRGGARGAPPRLRSAGSWVGSCPATWRQRVPQPRVAGRMRMKFQAATPCSSLARARRRACDWVGPRQRGLCDCARSAGGVMTRSPAPQGALQVHMHPQAQPVIFSTFPSSIPVTIHTHKLPTSRTSPPAPSEPKRRLGRP